MSADYPMTPETLAMAHRVLANPSASADSRAWFEDIVLWLEFGDIAAGRRCGYVPAQQQPQERAA